MKSVTIVSDDRVGLLADISYVLGKSNINIDGLVVDVIGGRAVISMEVKDPKKAKEVLENNGYKTTNPEAIVIKTPANYMEKINQILSLQKIQITESTTLSTDDRDTVVAINVDKPRKAAKMLGNFLLGHNPARSSDSG